MKPTVPPPGDSNPESSAQMVEPPAFSNGSMWEVWSSNYCDRCWHDRKARAGDYANGCPLIALGFAHQPVEQWVEAEPPRYVHCTKFTPDDQGHDEGPPVPQSPPPGQEQLFEAEPYNWDAERETVGAGDSLDFEGVA